MERQWKQFFRILKGCDRKPAEKFRYQAGNPAPEAPPRPGSENPFAARDRHKTKQCSTTAPGLRLNRVGNALSAANGGTWILKYLRLHLLHPSCLRPCDDGGISCSNPIRES